MQSVAFKPQCRVAWLKGAVRSEKPHGGPRVVLNLEGTVPVTGAKKAPLPGRCIQPFFISDDPEIGRTEQRRLLKRFVEGLSEEKQEVFRMVHDEEMETREGAERLGIPEGTVKSRVHHARKKIIRDWRQHRAKWEDD